MHVDLEESEANLNALQGIIKIMHPKEQFREKKKSNVSAAEQNFDSASSIVLLSLSRCFRG